MRVRALGWVLSADYGVLQDFYFEIHGQIFGG